MLPTKLIDQKWESVIGPLIFGIKIIDEALILGLNFLVLKKSFIKLMISSLKIGHYFLKIFVLKPSKSRFCSRHIDGWHCKFPPKKKSFQANVLFSSDLIEMTVEFFNWRISHFRKKF